MIECEWQVDQRRHGFIVTGVTPLAELNLTLVELRHERLGSRMVHLACEDDNNLFGVGFRTTPGDSSGVAHILEHTVLCGSQRYPVRDPFFTMLKRSLNTFMNALTSSDWTLYPFSSQNHKDFNNLMGIYLDATFFPLLRERDFRQEGHRLEYTEAADASSPLAFKGVVYNEMKGAMADPGSLLHRRLTKALFPTTTYGVNSGGEPEAILDLTHEQLVDFHRTYYHPANAYFFSYGNLPLEDHLAVIEEQALQRFEPLVVDTAVPDEVRFSAPQRVTEGFPVAADESLSQRSMVQVAWLTCPLSDSFENLALSLLSQLLLGNPAAPLYKALIESGLGQNLAPSTGYHDDQRETFLAAGLQGTDPEHLDAIEALVLKTLHQTAETGFSDEQIEAAIHQLELSHREVVGDQYPYALLLLMRMFGPWLHNDDPVSPLLLDANLARLRQELAAGPFFQNLIRRQLLDNPHRVTLLLQPDTELKEQQESALNKRLQDHSAQLSEADRQELVRLATELQQAQEDEEDLSCLPTLELSDIPATERTESCQEEQLVGCPLYRFPQPTNGIGYFTTSLMMNDVPADLIPLVPLFGALLPKIGAAGHSYLQMAERISASTGGISASGTVICDPNALGDFQLAFEVRSKALLRNQQAMFGILTDLFTAPDFSDLQRLHTVINQVSVSLENGVSGSGHSYAARSAGAALSSCGRLREEWGGLHLVRAVKKLAAQQPEQLAEFAGCMQRLAELVLCRSRLRCSVTAEQQGFAVIDAPLQAFLAAIPAGNEPTGRPAELTVSEMAVGWVAAVPVSYVARVFPAVPLIHADSAGLLVLAKLLRACYLHREVREKGGAYGGMSTYDAQLGLFSMLSYRDPHLLRTLQVYRDATEWAAAGSFSDEDIREAILAVFGNLDRPVSPSGKGQRGFGYRLQGLSAETRQALREGILAVDRTTLKRLADTYLLAGWDASAVGVVSAEGLLQEANKELGEKGLNLEKI